MVRREGQAELLGDCSIIWQYPVSYMKTAATGQPPIERALKTDVLTIGGIPTAILTDDDDDMVEWSTVDIDTQENKKSALDLTKKYPKHHNFLSNQEPASSG